MNSRKRLSTADEEEPTSSTASKQPRQSVEDEYHNKSEAWMKKENAELKRAMAEKDAALANSHEEVKKWTTRAWNERKRAEQFSEAVNELDHSTWTELTKDDDEKSDQFFDDDNNEEDEFMDENSDDDDTLVFNG
jgi:predicted transcriptional regulator